MMTQDPPEWLLLTIIPITIILIMGLLIWGAILEVRFINPYTLIKKSNKDKWRKATVLALLRTSMLLIFGLVFPVLSTPPERLPMFLYCNGVWIIVFPLAVLYTRWEFESHIKRYRYFDKMIKDKGSIYHNRIFGFSISLMKVFMPAEQKRFFSEGFPDDIDKTGDGETATEQL